MSEFTCCNCKVNYPRRNDEEWNDVRAAEELRKLYPETRNYPVDILCDDCNEEFKKWFSTLSESEKKKMRDDWEIVE